MKENYKVYVKVNDAGQIVAINSDAFLHNLEGWKEIDCGIGDKYHHAQNNYLEALVDDRGLFNYKLVGGIPVKRTEEEKNAEYMPPIVLPSLEERMAAIETAVALFKKLLGVKQ